MLLVVEGALLVVLVVVAEGSNVVLWAPRSICMGQAGQGCCSCSGGVLLHAAPGLLHAADGAARKAAAAVAAAA